VTAPTLEQAVKFLAARCDGARNIDGHGFNKLDVAFGHSLANKPYTQWTWRERRAIWRIIEKYKGQLRDGGIIYSQIPEPPIVQPTTLTGQTVRKTLSLKNGKIEIQFPYDSAIVGEIKSWLLPFYFDRERKLWAAYANPQTVIRAHEFGKKYEFEESPAIAEFVRQIQLSTAENIKGATAKEGKVEIPGLNGTLRPFQQAAILYTIRNRKVIIADEMGLGKTIEGIGAVEALQAYPSLVISLANGKQHWRMHVQDWTPKKSVAILEGVKDKTGLYYVPRFEKPITTTAEDAIAKADVVIINWDILFDYRPLLVKRHWQSIIIDEFHNAKNYKAQRTRAAKLLAVGYIRGEPIQGNPIPVRIALTGTPVINRPMELLSPLEILGRLGDFGGFKGYTTRYCIDPKEPGYYGAAVNLGELHIKLKATCYIRRLKKDVMPELPPLQRSIVPISITNRDLYDRTEEDLAHWFFDKFTRDHAAMTSLKGMTPARREQEIWRWSQDRAVSMEFAQDLVKMTALRRLAAEGSFKPVCDWIQNFMDNYEENEDGTSEKLVVFAYYKEIQKKLVREFPGCAHIFGAENATDVEAEKKRFTEDPKCRLMVCSLLTGGQLHNLAAASHAAFADVGGWTPKDYEQAEARIARFKPGTTEVSNSLNAWYLADLTTISRDVMHIVNAKKRVTTVITDGKRVEGHFNMHVESIARLILKGAQTE